MNRSQSLVAAALALASAAAQAGSVDVHRFDTARESALSRDAVRAELLAAREQGETLLGDGGIAFVVPPSIRSRAEVRAELAQAQRLGLTARGEGDALIATAEQQAQIDDAGRQAAMVAAHPQKAG